MDRDEDRAHQWEELAQLMIDLGVGVEAVARCRVYRADADSFADE